MAISKVIYKSSSNATPETWMDATTATAAAADITSPKTAMLADGVMTTGTGTGGGSVSVERKDVNFHDYDGTIVASYSASDFASLSSFPSNPTHDGLTAQGWNWTLSDAKTYVGKYGKLEIGQTYITDDYKTRLYCSFYEGRLAPYLGVGVNGTVVVDWGDNTETDTLTGSSLATVVHANHVYVSSGDYVITITVTSGSFSLFGILGLSHVLKKDTTISGTTSTFPNIRIYGTCLEKIEFGSDVTIDNYAFQYFYNLKSVIIPNSITAINSAVFSNCRSLNYISVPSSVTSIGDSAFAGCYSLACISLPNTITTFSNYTFNNASNLKYITIPDSVTSIGTQSLASSEMCSITIPDSVTSITSQAFYGDRTLGEIHFKSSTPPTLSNSNVFQNVQTDCIIYVPASADHSILAAYTSATNYPSSSTYTYMEE